MFPRAHAVAYVMMSARIAYYKVYHPVEFYAVWFTTKVAYFDEKVILRGQKAVEDRLNEIIRKGKDASKKEEEEITVLEVAYEMYARGYEFMPIDIFQAKAKHFQIIDGKLMPALNTIDGMGDKAAEGVVEAAKDGPFTSCENFKTRSKVSGTIVDKMREMGMLGDLPLSDQMSLLDFM